MAYPTVISYCEVLSISTTSFFFTRTAASVTAALQFVISHYCHNIFRTDGVDIRRLGRVSHMISDEDENGLMATRWRDRDSESIIAWNAQLL